MTKLFTQNKKMSDSTNNKYLVYNFGIPAYKSKTGLKTCPLAGICAKGCYAKSGAYIWSNVSQAFEKRLTETLKPNFSDIAQLELDKLKRSAERKNVKLVIRVHDSGDFYNLEYLLKWVEVFKNNPNVHFYTYTKMIPLFLKTKIVWPNNFRVIFSEGGLADKLIKFNWFHSRVFETEAELKAAGYSNASKNDLVAGLGNNPKIGLVFHGAKSKSWNTNK